MRLTAMATPTEFELLDVNGNFNGPLTIEFLGAGIYDSGTEVNDGQGALFSPVGGTASDEGRIVGIPDYRDSKLQNQHLLECSYHCWD